MKNIVARLAACAVAMAAMTFSASAQRSETLLEKGWKFHMGDIPESTVNLSTVNQTAATNQSTSNQSAVPEAATTTFDDSSWQDVAVPHDWAIYGPFDEKYDLQVVAVKQNGETKPEHHQARTGGLPCFGVGWYRTEFEASTSCRTSILFDGAMSNAVVYVNGQKAGEWRNGYNSFSFDVSDLVKDGKNLLAVRLENLERASRWYPGAGLYRNVHVISTADVHIPVWGTYITTPAVTKEYASVKLQISVENAEGVRTAIATEIFDPAGKKVAERTSDITLHDGAPISQGFLVSNPQLWSPETPYLYRAVTKLSVDGKQTDEYETRFGIRSISFVPEKGFFLNGEHRQIQGVCNHHDLGPLGAAVNVAALRRQITLLKEMGCDAIRTSHNMPAPELVALCDEMGMMMMVEPFDEWKAPKCENGYHLYFDEWAEKDMVNMVRHYRNDPSVIMWSIGNEVPSQGEPEGYKEAILLTDICHREDPSRLTTCAMDQVNEILSNGFAALIDIPGFNYRTFKYLEAYSKLPQGFILGSETAATLSSRGVYHFPIVRADDVREKDHQSSSYDENANGWSNRLDIDFAMAEDYPWVIGQFAWSGFDYIGEPTPYDVNSWPNHSSQFGIIDLAFLPKDRYWLYRSVWNRNEATLHVLPHWSWPGREGQVTPVYVYTSYPEAELFVNGVSQGRLKKEVPASKTKGTKEELLEPRFRLMWNDVVYQPGELKVVAYDANGNEAATEIVKTAGKPYALKVEADRSMISADGKDLSYLTVSVVDKNGVEVPTDSHLVKVAVSGAASFKAIANGDPTCLESFQEPQMHLFSGKLTALIQSTETAGAATVTVSAKGLKPATIALTTVK